MILNLKSYIIDLAVGGNPRLRVRYTTQLTLHNLSYIKKMAQGVSKDKQRCEVLR
jgi:hypothetical protein